MSRGGALLIVALLLMGCSDEKPSAETGLAVAPMCDAAVEPCRASGAGGTLTFALNNPRSMAPFDMVARWAGPPLETITVSLEMVGMEMGENRYRLQPDGEGRWRGRAILPICISGRSDWSAEIAVQEKGGASHLARIPFTVAR